jgi:hypothetical protein
MGWWGAQPKHLDKYVELYQEILPSAAVIAGTASSTSILWKDDVKLKQFARLGLEATAATLVEHHNTHLPILVHVFSNGGGYVWQQMMQLMDDDGPDDNLAEVQHPFPRSPPPPLSSSLYGSSTDEDDGNTDEKQKLLDTTTRSGSSSSIRSIDTEQTPPHANTTSAVVRQNIQGQIYDSCPAYPKFESGLAALEGSGMIPHRLATSFFKCLFVVVYWLESLWLRIQQRPHRLLVYWNELLENDWDIPQGFIYSRADRMVDADHLDDFIQNRRQHLSIPISVLKFEDSPHVQHFRYHPEAYREFVSKFVQENLLEQPEQITNQ